MLYRRRTQSTQRIVGRNQKLIIRSYGDATPPPPSAPVFVTPATIFNLQDETFPFGILSTGDTAEVRFSAVGQPLPTYSYQWSRGASETGPWTNIAGATGKQYVTTEASEDQFIRVVVTATNSEGSATSEAVTYQFADQPIPVPPTAGTVTIDVQTLDEPVGSTFAATLVGWNLGNPTAIVTYDWQSDGVTRQSGVSATYQTTAQDAGRTLTCQVTASNPAGTAGPVTSNGVLITGQTGGRAGELLASEQNGLAIAFADNTQSGQFRAGGSLQIKNAGAVTVQDTVLGGGVVRAPGSSVKWVRGPDGLMREVAADALPVEYDTSGNSLGVLNEPEATNSFKVSNDFTYEAIATDGWGGQAGNTRTPNSGISPSGQNDAWELNTVNSVIQQVVGGQTAPVNGCFTLWAKRGGSNPATHLRLTTNNSGAWNTGIGIKHALTDDWQRIVFIW